MACCTLPGGCGVPYCYLCSLNAPMAERRDDKPQANPTRGGEPKLAIERKRGEK